MTSSATAASFRVDVEQGALRGGWSDDQQDVQAFLGLPYAAPPVGALRWRPPQPVASWSGVREASQPGPACPQHPAKDAFVWSRGDFEANEDCLYLNVYTQPKTDELRPVMVWFHGGAHTTGMAHAAIFEGSNLARRDVVVVTVNYRLGALGFLAHPALAEEAQADYGRSSSGNYGLMDKIAALQWVHKNIHAFGGDPYNVTIFGQSAGSQSVCALLTSPLTKNLFRQAIGQSAGCPNLGRRDPSGQTRGARLIEHALEGSEVGVEQMRALTPQQLLSAETATQWSDQSRIVLDGYVLPEPPQQVLQRGAQHPAPLMLGFAANEGEQLLPLDPGLTEAAFDAWLSKAHPGREAALRRAYAGIASPGLMQREILTDQFMMQAMHEWADAHAFAGNPVFMYYMEHVPPAFKLYDTQAPDLALADGPRSAGAYHSGDLAFVFNNTRKLGLHWSDGDHKLSDTMANYWAAFAHSGAPQGKRLPPWPVYNATHRRTQVFAWPVRTVSHVRKERMTALTD